MVGVSLLPGSLTSERVKFWLSPTMMPSAKAASRAALIGAGGRGQGKGLDALVLAVAAIGVGVEVADEGALDGGACAWSGRKQFRFRKSEDQFPDAARFDEAHGGSGGIAHFICCGLGLLAQADEKQALGGHSGRSMQQHRLIGASLVFAAQEHGGRGGLDGSVRCQQHGLGLGVGGFGGLCVGRQNGQHFGFNSCKGGKGELSIHHFLSVFFG